MKSANIIMKFSVLVFAAILIVMTLTGCDLFGCQHDYAENIVLPTCTEGGYTEHTCANCSDSYKDSFVPVTAHRFNGGDCIYCNFKQPEEAITPDTEWYAENVAVFTLTTKEQLAGLAALVNEGTTFANTVIYLDADIDLGWSSWTPIGNADFAFAGHLVGNGHTISNLNLYSTGSYVGLFGNSNGELSDFTIDNASVFVSGANNYIGILCGYATNKITQIKVDGYVDAKDSSNVGGIIGYTTHEISFCESTTDVVGYEKVGGIVGSANVSATVFKNLVNYGSITGNGTYAGGLFGGIWASKSVIYIDNAENYGDVTGIGEIGGLVGYVEGKVGSIIQSSKSSAKISGEYIVGGLVGNAVNVAISGCSNEGSEISASSCLLEGDVYYAYLGGYVGKGYSVDHCVNSADIEYLARGIYVGGIAGYLSEGVTECSNSGNITGYDQVGGIAGYVATPNAISVINLSNTGNITGKSRVGGIAGQWTYANLITFGEISNSGKVNGTSYLGGIIGYFNYSKEVVLSAYNLTNTGDVSGSESYIGGLFGYVNGKDSSVISNASVSANISGLYLVGGLIGKAEKVLLSDSTNEGSTVTATGFIIEGEETNVYLGGYVGIGYKISGCTNNVDINYTSLGNYVGGIVGLATSELHNCTNNASITSNASKVGGIAGEVNSDMEGTFNNLINKGDIKGADRVGGIIGNIIQITNKYGTAKYQDDVRYEGNTMYGYSYKHYYCLITTLTGLENTGNVTASFGIVGGIIGGAYFESTYYNSDVRNHCAGGFWGCIIYSQWKIDANELLNSGEVSGTTNVGEMIGSFASDVASIIDNYTVTGKITMNNQELEGTYDVGSNTNLTLSGRVVYVPEVTEGYSTNTEE